MDRAQLAATADRLQEVQRRFCAGCTHESALPDRESVATLCRELLGLVFPGFFTTCGGCGGHLDTYTRHRLLGLDGLLRRLLSRSLAFQRRADGAEASDRAEHQVDEWFAAFLDALPQVGHLIASDVEAMYRNDPAASSAAEIVAAYPGLEAIAVQRFAHVLYRMQVPVLPRMMTEAAHSRTGIDINPGASIGECFAIDHGTGVVIGETCTIGSNCMLYHGVTLGAFNPLRKDDDGNLPRGAANKRHPDLEDHVIVYPGATILGGQTRIGHHSIIGGNVWLTQSVEAYTTVTIADPDLVIRNKGTGKVRRTGGDAAR